MGKPSPGWWQRGEQGHFATPLSGSAPRLSGQGAPSIWAPLCAGMDPAAAPSGQYYRYYLLASGLEVGESRLGAGPQACEQCVPRSGRAGDASHPCSCREGKKQLQPNSRYLIHCWPKYPVSSGNLGSLSCTFESPFWNEAEQNVIDPFLSLLALLHPEQFTDFDLNLLIRF